MAAATLLEIFASRIHLFHAGRQAGVLPLNFNFGKDGLVHKGQFICIDRPDMHENLESRLISLTRDLILIPSTESRPAERKRLFEFLRHLLDATPGVRLDSFERNGREFLVARPKGCDGRFFRMHDIPVNLSRPFVGKLHGIDEWIDAASMVTYCQICMRYIEKRLSC